MTSFLISILNVFNTEMQKPQSYGLFHLTVVVLSIGLGVLLCVTHKKGDDKRVRRVVFIVAAIVALLEVYKQIVYTFDVVDGNIVSSFQWYSFPMQFCSTPMYIGLLTGLFRKGKVHNALVSYLATYAMFAGICVMAYPGDIFTRTLGINIQTSICHGSMITVGIYLWYTGYVKFEKKTLIGAASVFCSMIAVAIILNEVVFYSGVLNGQTFNMFFISPHFPSTLPVYSSAQKVLPFPLDLVVYISVFTLAAFIVMASAFGIKKLCTVIKDKAPKRQHKVA